jgi:hypothetical protein
MESKQITLSLDQPGFQQEMALDSEDNLGIVSFHHNRLVGHAQLRCWDSG